MQKTNTGRMTAEKLAKSFIGSRPITGEWQTVRLSENQVRFIRDLFDREQIGTPHRGMGDSRVSRHSVVGHSAIMGDLEVNVNWMFRRFDMEFRSVAGAEAMQMTENRRYFLADLADEREFNGPVELRCVTSPQGNRVVQIVRDGNVIRAMREEFLPNWQSL